MPKVGTKQSGTTLLTLQAGRGLAALAVLVHHACNGVIKQGGDLPEWLERVAAFGYLGVDFFFVLSGFIIYYVNQPRQHRPDFATTYIEARLIRVYIPYLPIGIAVGLAYLTFPNLSSGGGDHWNWLSTLTLLPSDAFPALSPAWTLQHEIIFYFIALLAFRFKAFIPVSAFFAAAACAVWMLAPMSYKGFGLIDLEFAFGIFVAWCFLNDRLRQSGLQIVIGTVVCALFFVEADRFLSVIFGAGLACLLLPIVRAEAAGRIRIGPVLLLLGNASYAIYLVHYPIVSALARLGAKMSGPASFLVIVAVSVAVGIVYHKLYETHALRLARKLLDSLRHTGKTRSVATSPLAPSDLAIEEETVKSANSPELKQSGRD